MLECLSSDERYEYDVRQSVFLANLIKELGSIEAGKACFGGGAGSAIIPDGNPLGLHYAMFLPTLMNQVNTFFQTLYLK